MSREVETSLEKMWLRKVIRRQNTQKMFYKPKRRWRSREVMKLTVWGRA